MIKAHKIYWYQWEVEWDLTNLLGFTTESIAKTFYPFFGPTVLKQQNHAHAIPH